MSQAYVGSQVQAEFRGTRKVELWCNSVQLLADCGTARGHLWLVGEAVM